MADYGTVFPIRMVVVSTCQPFILLDGVTAHQVTVCQSHDYVTAHQVSVCQSRNYVTAHQVTVCQSHDYVTAH